MNRFSIPVNVSLEEEGIGEVEGLPPLASALIIDADEIPGDLFACPVLLEGSAISKMPVAHQKGVAFLDAILFSISVVGQDVLHFKTVMSRSTRVLLPHISRSTGSPE